MITALFLKPTLNIYNVSQQSAYMYMINWTFFAGIVLPAYNFANRLDPDQARHFVGSDLDANCLTLR